MIKHQNMVVYSTKWNEKSSFRMMPVSNDCPFNEAIFDPEQKVLAVISKDKKEKPMMMPRITDKGDIIPTKRASGEQGWQEQRIIIPAYYEYYLEDINDIVGFVQAFAINSDAPAFINTLNGAFELAGADIFTEEGRAHLHDKVKKSKAAK